MASEAGLSTLSHRILGFFTFGEEHFIRRLGPRAAPLVSVARLSGVCRATADHLRAVRDAAIMGMGVQARRWLRRAQRWVEAHLALDPVQLAEHQEGNVPPRAPSWILPMQAWGAITRRQPRAVLPRLQY